MKKSLILTTVVVLALGLRAETNAVFKCEVKVLDAAGQPVVGAVVERFPVNPFLTPTEPLPAVGRDTTDRNGAVLLTSTNQAFYSVVASKPGLGITWGGWYPGQMPDQEDAVVELAFTAPKTVAGIVQDAAGKPVAGVAVWVKTTFLAPGDKPNSWSFLPSSVSRRCFSAQTGADGKFRIEGLPEGTKLDLAITQPGMALDRPHESTAFMNPAFLEVESGQSDIVLTLKPAGVIEGRVVKSEAGEPVAGARVTFAGSTFGDDSIATAMSGSDGGFRFTDLEAGEYQLQARLGANEPPDLVGEVESVTVQAGATNRQAKLTLTPGGLLEVTVKNSSDDKPVLGALVHATAGGVGPAKPVRTSEKGVARFRLTPGDYQVFAQQGTRSASAGQVGVE